MSMPVIIFVRFDAEDSYQASSRSRSFLESPMQNGPLTERMEPGTLSSYFLHPPAGKCVVCVSFFVSSFLYMFISIHAIYSFHELLNDVNLIVYLKLSPDIRGLSSIPGGNYISQGQKGGPSDNDNVTCVTGSQKAIDLASWKEILEHPTRGFHSSVSSHESLTALQSASTGIVLGKEDLTRGQHLTGGSVLKEEVQNLEPMHSNWQVMIILIPYPFVHTHVNLLLLYMSLDVLAAEPNFPTGSWFRW